MGEWRGSSRFSKNDPGLWLRQEFLQRQQRNPHYSLRSFARHLEISPGRLSEILSRKRNLSAKAFQKIADKLAVSPEERKHLSQTIRATKLGANSEKALEELAGNESRAVLSEDEFQLLVDWRYFAVLSLINTKDFEHTPQFISRRLGLSLTEAVDAVERLERIGLIAKENGKFVRTQRQIGTTQDVHSHALRKAHEKILLHAMQSLDEASLSDRSITSLCFAIDPAQLPKAKMLIQAFKATMEQALETENRTEVYHLNIQLVPVTQRENA